MKKTVILDKSYLESRNQCQLSFALKTHRVVITPELLYEIGTDGRGLPVSTFLNKLRSLDVCQSRLVVSLVQQEVSDGKPASIIDSLGTDGLKNALNSGQSINGTISNSAKKYYGEDAPDDLRKTLQQMWSQDFDTTFTEAEAALSNGGNSFANIYMKHWGPCLGKAIAQKHNLSVEPDAGWVLWGWSGMINYLAFKYRLNGTKPCDLSNNKVLENAVLDVHYAALLAGADGIATHDTELADIVRAFFPQKFIIAKRTTAGPNC